MHSRTTERFRLLFDSLPKPVQEKASAAYRLWSRSPNYPSLRFKKIHATLPIYSVRVDLGYRAVGILDEGTVIWYLIGSHAEYDKLLRKL